ncbi:hypothetical protein NE237_001841 [Protea cynaroides]|uniref:VWFA domain-containing protein n=1 Tax=Protea cynaroides TaxID=273540 RepID=A0A9Q0QYH4_9MAGN|nr:hypothetical protein NE237_001841 [Protea cynaroides]
MEKLKSILSLPVDWNCKLIFDENAIISTHAPNDKEVDVSALYSLIQKILIPLDTTIDQVDLDFHLKSFQKSSYFQELFKIVHKNCCQLSCKCSGGGDANSTMVALFKTWSVYSWKVKMVLALAAFSIIYWECLLMADQTDPLAESIKLLKQLPNKSKLSKIQSLILVMVKLTKTIYTVNDLQSENISTYIQTVVCWTVGSVVVCTSQIIGFDDEYTVDELSKLTEFVDGMNSRLDRLVGIGWTIDENDIRKTHAPDYKEVKVGPLYKLINEILIASDTIIVKGASGDQLSCECSGGGVVNSKTVALFKTLSQYSWEVKMVLALAAFSVIYGELSLMVNHSNPLVKLMKQVLDKSKLLKIKSLIDAMVKVTNTIVDVINVDKSRPVDISTYMESTVSWTVGSIIVCTSQIIGLDNEYTENQLANSTKMVDGMNAKLVEDLSTKRIEKVAEDLKGKGLGSSNLILGIDFTKSNEWQETTKDKMVFSFLPENTPCKDLKEVLEHYEKIAPKLELFGPTSFAPIVDAAIDIVEKSGGQHHVLVIIADGQVTQLKEGHSPQEKQTIESIVTASSYALSIVLVGVGDGPWDEMKMFCDNIPGRQFDNFQFVNFTDIMKEELNPSKKEAAFAQVALEKIPDQYKKSEELKLLGWEN